MAKRGQSIDYNSIPYTIEELMEMTGAILFMHALLRYLARHNAQVSIVNKEGGESEL
ncbi:hypothetical protein [Pontibacter russatus]|uniref:hypothetical protein n=1 Tax=Pontibacter russatus TaxID=2694929 RepID=UPI0013797A40|nr:hypothetical protein [Pontibacter russatus]